MNIDETIREVVERNPEMGARDLAEMIEPTLNDEQRKELVIHQLIVRVLQRRTYVRKQAANKVYHKENRTNSKFTGGRTRVVSSGRVVEEELHPLDQQLLRQLEVPIQVPGLNIPVAYGKLTSQQFDLLIKDRENRIAGFTRSVTEFQYAKNKIIEAGASCLNEVYATVAA
jgi:hypothetical protein